MTGPTTLPGALAAEIARVSRLKAEYEEAGRLGGPRVNVRPAVAMMNASLQAAISAAGSPDVVGQARALADLREYS